MKPKTWIHTKPNTPERSAAIITDSVNAALAYRDAGLLLRMEEELRTLMRLNIRHD